MTTQMFLRRVGRAVQDASFIIGALLVSLLILIAVLGPVIAPHNPYIREPIKYIDGELVSAPVDPGVGPYVLGTDALGRDLLSLLLYGARTTLGLAAVATMVRMLLGLVLGTLSGWWPGRLFDRLVSAASDLLASVPSLILAMMIVFALGIRRGLPVFVVAVALVGWGEVAQIVRSHVLTIRQELYIEAARALGLGQLQILSRHVLPNLLSTMLALGAIQMGTALLLLGELGFVNVFIAGGATLAGDAATPSQVISDVPDWGAMLGTAWPSFQSRPWLPAFPAAAFLISILSFNLFGYGLQRFFEKGRFYPSGWSVMRFLVAIVAVLFGAQFVLNSTGPESEFRGKARAFDASRAMADVVYLTQPEFEGRAPGTDGGVTAASYIAATFGENELTPTITGTYFQPYSVQHGQVVADPILYLLGPDGEPEATLESGFSYDPTVPFSAIGYVEGDLQFIANPLQRPGRQFLFLPGEMTFFIGEINRSFFNTDTDTIIEIRVVPDEQAAYTGAAPPFAGPTAFLESKPYFVIGETQAYHLLSEAGYDVNDFKESYQDALEPVMLDLGRRVKMQYGMQFGQVSGVNVVGYLPGLDIRVQTQRILVVAPYSTPSPRNEETFFPGANDNASGVAVMLEVIRTFNEQEFVPKRTIMFVALDEVGGQNFVENPVIPLDESDTWTTVIISGVGAGDERLSRFAAGGGGLAATFDQSARTMRTRPQALGDYLFFFQGAQGRGWEQAADSRYSGIVVTRTGDPLSGTSQDTVFNLDANLLEEAGQTLAHYLMVLSSQ